MRRTVPELNPNRIEVKTNGAVTRQAIYAMLSGATGKPTWDKLVLLCAQLGVRPEWLAEGELPMHPAPHLDDEEIALVQAFKEMSHAHQRDLTEIARRWAEEDSDDRGSTPFRNRNMRRQ